MLRSRIDIIIEILDAARTGANKTSMIHRTDLNLNTAEKYLDLLQKHGLMNNRRDKYITTEKGRSFLEDAKAVTLRLDEAYHELPQ